MVKFFITTASAAHLNGKHVVFGEVDAMTDGQSHHDACWQVLEGYEFVQKIEDCGSNRFLLLASCYRR